MLGGLSDTNLAAVKASSQAWLSYALGSETLIAAAPQEGDLRVEEFAQAEDGSFAFTVRVKDVAVGSDAAAENLKKVFGLEGVACGTLFRFGIMAA